MNIILNNVGGFLFLAGGVFFLQGINVITVRSFMRGNPEWVVYGGLMAIIGVGLLLFANWKRIQKK
jgi:hypothetical protein